MRSLGGPTGVLSEPEMVGFVQDAVGSLALDGRSVCIVVPDDTRSCPLPLLLRAVHGVLHGRAARITVLVALGTHPEMSRERLVSWVGGPYADTAIEQHAWWEESTFVQVGSIPRTFVHEVSGGLLDEDVPVRVNRAVVEHDLCLVVGPVFPHEVVGFSGGDKYFFPGVSGPEVIGTSHWLGALIGSRHIIGTTGITPVRALVHRAAELLPTRRACLALVVASGTGGVHFAALSEPPVEAWTAAAAVSAQTHVTRFAAPVDRVLSVVSERYDEMWTAAKGFYKVEPIVADGGEVTLFAPHVRAVSHTFHDDIMRVGYHCRAYILANMDRFEDVPRSVLAHSTHVRGDGIFDAGTGEHARVRLVLATGIDRATVEALGVGYRDPATVDVAEWADDPHSLVVPNAGEILHAIRTAEL